MWGKGGAGTWKKGRGRERERQRRTEREREAGQKHVGEGKWEKVREEGGRERERFKYTHAIELVRGQT